MFRSCLLALSLLLIASHVTPAQTTIRASYTQDRARIISLSDMTTPDDRRECGVGVLSGSIVGVDYNDDGVAMLGFVLKVRGKGRDSIGLSESFYQRLPNITISMLGTLIKKGQRVRVKVYRCGSGAIATADQVSVLPVK